MFPVPPHPARVSAVGAPVAVPKATLGLHWCLFESLVHSINRSPVTWQLFRAAQCCSDGRASALARIYPALRWSRPSSAFRPTSSSWSESLFNHAEAKRWLCAAPRVHSKAIPTADKGSASTPRSRLSALLYTVSTTLPMKLSLDSLSTCILTPAGCT